MKILEILTPKRNLGNFGERAAAKYLKKQGYKILERNYVYNNHEIDLIARRGDVTVFAEVKCRTAGYESPKEPRPASAVTPKKQRAIIDTAHGYMLEYGCKGRKRLDVIEVYAERTGKGLKVKEIKHLEGAFTRDTAAKCGTQRKG